MHRRATQHARRDGTKFTVVLTTKTGKPFKKRDFAAQWKKATEAAGITDLHFNDLRGTAVTLLSEAGNTVQQVASSDRPLIENSDQYSGEIFGSDTRIVGCGDQ